MTIIRSSLLITLLFITSCLCKESFDARGAVSDLVKNGIIVNINSDEDALFRQLGQPLKREEKIVQNPYYHDVKDHIIRCYYPGLEIVFYHHKHPQHGWKGIVSIEVSSNDYSLKYDIKIGMSVSDIYRRFGQSPYPPFEGDGMTYLLYATDESAHGQILFVLKNEKLAKFLWSNWP